MGTGATLFAKLATRSPNVLYYFVWGPYYWAEANIRANPRTPRVHPRHENWYMVYGPDETGSTGLAVEATVQTLKEERRPLPPQGYVPACYVVGSDEYIVTLAA